MTIFEIINKFVSDIQLTKWQEWISTISQIASVWYARSNNVLVYPTGIIGVLFAFYIYLYMAQPPLYADAILNLYYFIMSIYGWYNWSKIANEAYQYPISWCNKKELANGLFIFIFGWLAIYYILKLFTDSNTPILDSLVSSTAVTAMWWMSKRKIENWLAWIVSNIIAIPLNYYKGFMLFTAMYALFLCMAILGFRHWKRRFMPI